MTQCQFFWYMVVNSLVALGTIGAVFVALFGKKFYRPKLELTLANPKGELAKWTVGGKDMSARFYQVRVTNRRRWSPANNVGIHLIGIDEQRPDDAVTCRRWGL